jgi:dienelactone hydrolase
VDEDQALWETSPMALSGPIELARDHVVLYDRVMIDRSDRPPTHAPEIALFHSVLGLRPGVLQWAARLRGAGYVVHTPDLYGGEVFADPAEAAEKLHDLNLTFDEILARSQRAVADLPNELVYAGFSNGGACAELLAATRPGARGAILMHAPLPIRDLGWQTWPATVPVQVHFAERDPLRNQAVVDVFVARVRAAGAHVEQFLYPCAGHLFADPDRPAFNAASSEKMFATVLDFLKTRA